MAKFGRKLCVLRLKAEIKRNQKRGKVERSRTPSALFQCLRKDHGFQSCSSSLFSPVVLRNYFSLHLQFAKCYKQSASVLRMRVREPPAFVEQETICMHFFLLLHHQYKYTPWHIFVLKFIFTITQSTELTAR